MEQQGTVRGHRQLFARKLRALVVFLPASYLKIHVKQTATPIRQELRDLRVKIVVKLHHQAWCELAHRLMAGAVTLTHLLQRQLRHSRGTLSFVAS